MDSNFQNRKCPKCGSTDLAHHVTWISGTIPTGVEGEIVCRQCLYWETLLTTQDAKNVFDMGMWVVLEAGQGMYSNKAERAQRVTYHDPKAAHYPRLKR